MELVSTLYIVGGIACALAVLPQLRTLWRDTTGAASTSLASWLVFSVCSVISVMYAATQAGDDYFLFCSALMLVANSSVLALASVKRAQSLAKARKKA